MEQIENSTTTSLSARTGKRKRTSKFLPTQKQVSAAIEKVLKYDSSDSEEKKQKAKRKKSKKSKQTNKQKTSKIENESNAHTLESETVKTT